MEQISWRLEIGDAQDHKMLFNTMDMQKYKIAAMEPLVVGNNLVLAAFPGSSHQNVAVVSTISACNIGELASVSIKRLSAPLYMAKFIEINSRLSSIQLASLKDHILRAKFVTQDQRVSFKFLDQDIQVKLVVIPDKQALPWVPIGHEDMSQHMSEVAFVVRTQSTIVCRTQASLQHNPTKLGGLAHEYNIVYDAIDLPLRHPEVYRMYGMNATKGILLHGTSGTGKTMLVRTVAQSIGCNLTIVTAADVSSKYQGETESKLKLLFEQAYENSPSIIFIDEIDTLCPKRDDSVGETEKRVVASLLTLMDGIQTDAPGKHVVVVAATNRPNSLDAALRRPGRFEKEIEIGVPSSTARLDIFNLYLELMPHSLSQNQIQLLADSTHGYVGADIAGMCREAGSQAMQRYLQNPQQPLQELQKVSYQDMLHAKNQVKASAMREVSIEVPHTKWTDIGGQTEIKRMLQESIEWPIKNPQVFKKLGIAPPKGVLLYGPPGCSKTLLAKAVASESKLNFFAIKGSELYSKWVGESERAVKEVFRKARQASPSIIFFDEIDALASSRSDSSTSVSERVLTALLTEMDGIEQLVNVIVIAATNRPDIIDPALMRPGRFDRLLYVTLPDYEARVAIFKLRTANMPLFEVELNRLALASEGYSGAEIVAICQEAALFTLKNYPVDVSDAELDKIRVTMEDFECAFRKSSPRTTKDHMAYYENFRKR